MNLTQLSDQNLLKEIKRLAQNERDITTQILHHLMEVERRRLYADCGCSSLFDYAVKELKYSEGQAGRRIRALRLIKEVPEVEAKIASGALSLSNAAQAQSFFRELSKTDPSIMPTKEKKLAVIQSLENKSTREAQRTLCQIQPEAAIPKEKERVVASDKVQVSFVMDDQLKAQLEEVRALAGPKAAAMNYNELFKLMAQLSVERLTAKRFGKKRSQAKAPATGEKPTPTPAQKVVTCEKQAPSARKPASRHIPRPVQYTVWQRDRGQCQQCGSRRNLQYDHIKPHALFGPATVENIRLLCGNCNQRAAMKVFGVGKINAKGRVSI